MRRFNYAVEMGPGIHREMDLASCGHCQHQMMVPPSKDGRIIVRVAPTCSGCGKFICNECYGKGCEPWEKQMEKMEARERMLNSILKG